MRDKLFRVFILANNVVANEVHQSDSVRPVLELEVQPMVTRFFFNLNALFLGVVLKDQLF